ncbi:DUF4389 domain-containing protein [Pseudomonadota bacterium]|nr:DUF4389 domain-containing protein [Pseudomonadota bacterium]
MAEQNQEQIKQNLKDSSQWMRILYMVLFAIILYFASMVTGLLIVVQAIFALITGEDNKNLRELGAGLAQYINQIYLFLTYNDQRKPFPFAAWGEVEDIMTDVAAPHADTDTSEVIEAEIIVEDDKSVK